MSEDPCVRGESQVTDGPRSRNGEGPGAAVGWDPPPLCTFRERPSPAPLTESSLPAHTPSLDAWTLRSVLQPEPSSQRQGGHRERRGRKSRPCGSSLPIHTAGPTSGELGQPSPCPSCRGSPPGPSKLLGRYCWDTSPPNPTRHQPAPVAGQHARVRPKGPGAGTQLTGF